jgi:hypothetical protein
MADLYNQAGIRYTVFERESSSNHFRPREWGMSIHWSRPLLDQLLPDDLIARLREAQNDPSFNSTNGFEVAFYNGKTGEHLKDQPMANAIRVSRKKMRAFCAQGIDIEVSTLRPDGNGADEELV